MKLFKRKPTWTCGYYEVTVRGKPVKRVMLILQDPRYPRKFYELQLTQDQSRAELERLMESPMGASATDEG